MLDQLISLDTAQSASTGMMRLAEITPQTGVTALTLFAGTTILTLRGEVAVETLIPGEKIITRDSGMVLLYDLEMSRAKVPAIRVMAGSLGHTRPHCDTLLSTDTVVNVRDWRADALAGATAAPIAAADLVDGEFVAAEPASDKIICTLIFDRSHVIYADGLELCARAR